MLKACGRCGKIHGYNDCPVKRAYKTTDERKDRATSAWKNKSIEIREKAQGLCEVCRDHGVYTYNGLEVHHIQKIREGGALLDDNNLICLCVSHHKAADKGDIKADYLKSLVEKRER